MREPHAVDRVRQFLIAAVAEITGLDPAELHADFPLIGGESGLSSRDLVELLLAVEDFAEAELGARFNWNSPDVLANQAAIFGSVDALAAHVAGLPRTAESDQ